MRKRNLPEIGGARNLNPKTCEKEQKEREISKFRSCSVCPFGRGMRVYLYWWSSEKIGNSINGVLTRIGTHLICSDLLCNELGQASGQWVVKWNIKAIQKIVK